MGYLDDIESLKLLKVSVFDDDDYDLQNEYLRACAQAAPDDTFSIEILMQGFHRGRREADSCIGKIRKSENLRHVLGSFIQDTSLFELYYEDNTFRGFFRRLEEGESISKEDKQELVSLLRELLKKIISNAPNSHDYQLGSGTFSIALWLARHEADFLLALIDKLPEKVLTSYRTRELFARALKPDQVEPFIGRLRDSRDGNFIIEGTLGGLGTPVHPEKEAIEQEARKYYPDFYERKEAIYASSNWQDKVDYAYDKVKEQLEIYQETFYPGMLSNLSEYEIIIDEKLTEEEIGQLKRAVIKFFRDNSLIHYRSYTFGSTNNLIINYPNVLRLALRLDLNKELIEYRQQFLCFLPLTENENDLQFLLDYLSPITDDDKKVLVSFCENRTDDLLALNGVGFAKTVVDLELLSLIPVLKDLLSSSKVSIYNKKGILISAGAYFARQEKKFFDELFQQYDSDDEERKALAELANEYLISELKDNSAIDWRFEQLKQRKEAKSEYGELRGVSELESEFDHLDFAKCLINLNDSKFIDKFLDLLDFSFDMRAEPEFVAYSNYLQKVVYAFYAGLKSLKANYLHELRNKVANYPNAALSNSFREKLRDLELKYAGEQQKSIHQSANIYNSLQAKIYERIHHPLELLHTILDVIRNEVTEEIRQGGLYAPIQKLVNGKNQSEKNPDVNEDLIQKMLKLSLENNLQRRGFRGTDIHREVELYDGKRYDFLIKYGFVGPIVVEIKLENNPEITDGEKRNKYKEKMQQYLQASSTKLGLYIVFKVKPQKNNYYETLRNEYNDIEGLYLKQVDCTK